MKRDLRRVKRNDTRHRCEDHIASQASKIVSPFFNVQNRRIVLRNVYLPYAPDLRGARFEAGFRVQRGSGWLTRRAGAHILTLDDAHASLFPLPQVRLAGRALFLQSVVLLQPRLQPVLCHL